MAESKDVIINATDDSESNAITKIESLCMNCHENGETRILLHRIPHFKDLIISSFSCPHCNYSNNEVQSASSIMPKGVNIKLQVKNSKDMDRQIVVSENCTLQVPDIDLEIPPSTKQAKLNTIEGIISEILENLQGTLNIQNLESLMNEINKDDENHESREYVKKLEGIISQLKEMMELKNPFTIQLDDPSGNSYIERLEGSNGEDEVLTVVYFERAVEQLHQMGYYESQQTPEGVVPPEEGADIPENLRSNKVLDLRQGQDDTPDAFDESCIQLPVQCPHCGVSTTNNVCEIDIPGFRRCLIFAFVCPDCGARNSEFKAAGAFGAAARKWILNVENVEDLNRDVLKSDSASIEIPSLDFYMEGGVEGGMFTTVEGVLSNIASNLATICPFSAGDAASKSKRDEFMLLEAKLKTMQEGQPEVLPFTIIINDPSDCSFVGHRASYTSEKVPEKDSEEMVFQKSTDTYKDGTAAAAVAKALEAAKRAPRFAKDATNLEEAVKNVQPGDVLYEENVDANLNVVIYRRTEEQDDSLGISDMNVDHYQE